MYPPLKLPGEPDALTELRLRDELRALRSVATSIEEIEWLLGGPTPARAKKFLEKLSPEFLEKLPPIQKELEEAQKKIWEPGAIAERIIAASPVLRLEPILKERLLQVEAFFVEKGWSLPKWTRPGWLSRS